MATSIKSTQPDFIGWENPATARTLGLNSLLDLRNASACRHLVGNPVPSGLGRTLVFGIFKWMGDAWLHRIPPKRESEELWREEHQLYIGANNTRLETVHTKSFATLSNQQKLPYRLCNEVPSCAGFTDSRRNRKSSVDLVRTEDDFIELIEMKWGNHNPLYALIQVLHYAMALFYARSNPVLRSRYGHRRALGVPRVELVVLAPREFYARCSVNGAGASSSNQSLASLCDCRPFAVEILDGLDHLRRLHSGIPEVSISFRSFPHGFKPPIVNGAQVRLLQQGQLPAEARYLQRALNSLGTMWRVQ